MQTKFSQSVAGVFAALFFTNVAAAHPGHAPTDLAAQVFQPFAGPDHLVAFVALTSVLLAAFGAIMKAQNRRMNPARVPKRRYGAAAADPQRAGREK